MESTFRSLLSFFSRSSKTKTEVVSGRSSVGSDLKNDSPAATKAEIFDNLKLKFNPPKSSASGIASGKEAVKLFILNHSLDFDRFESEYSTAIQNVPNEKLEPWLRKKISSEYKKRSDLTSKCRSIFYAQKQIELVLSQKLDVGNHSGFKRLHTSLADEEYIPDLLKQLHYYSEYHVANFNEKSLQDKVDGLFKTLATRKYATKIFGENLSAYESAKTASEKHLLINGIVAYLARKAKFNPKMERELIEWCERDILLYQDFLRFDAELHFSSNLPFEEILEDPEKPKKLAALMRFSDVKELEGYFVPRLPSFDALVEIYKANGKGEKLHWLRKLSDVIGYRFNEELPPIDSDVGTAFEIDFDNITKKIDVKKSGKKGKSAYLDSKGNACSTEDAFVDRMKQEGWNVLRAEVSFWQAVFCLFYYEEIFEGPVRLIPPNDIPADMFSGEEFYVVRKPAIDKKHERLKKTDISAELRSRINKYKNAQTRLLDFGPNASFVDVLSDKKVSEFFDMAGAEKVAEVILRLAKNLRENRAGVTDFVIWRDDVVRFVEVKKEKERVRDTQLRWLKWYTAMDFDVMIYRLKAV